MFIWGAIVFLTIWSMLITLYVSYRVFNAELSVWSRKGALLTWLPLVAGLILAVSPLGAVTYQGYANQGKADDALALFLEQHPETEEVIRADKGETWIFTHMNGGDIHTTLLIGEAFLEITRGPSPDMEMITESIAGPASSN